MSLGEVTATDVSRH